MFGIDGSITPRAKQQSCGADTELVHPLIKQKMKGDETGEILLGTVHGDIHDLGKNIFGMMMTYHGFKVIDIGVDVPPEEFVRQAWEKGPDIIGADY